MKRVYIAESLIDGQLFLDSLENAGIPAELFHQNASGGLGELPVTHPEIWVLHDADEDNALHIIDRIRLSSLSPEQSACSTCGESSPASFEICWQCHTPFSATPE